MIDEHTRLQASLKAKQSDEDATIRRMAKAGYSDPEIGGCIGRDRQWVRRRRCELELQPGYNRSLGVITARLHLRRLCGRVAA